MDKVRVETIYCSGILTDGMRCGRHMFTTNGHFLFISGLIVNPDADRQRIRCDKCGFTIQWRRIFRGERRTSTIDPPS